MLPQRRHLRAANPSGASDRGERGLVKVERSRARGRVASNTLTASTGAIQSPPGIAWLIFLIQDSMGLNSPIAMMGIDGT